MHRHPQHARVRLERSVRRASPFAASLRHLCGVAVLSLLAKGAAREESDMEQIDAAATPSHGPAGWYPDPMQEHASRYWDGATWTEHVSDNSATPCPPEMPTVAPAP